MSTALNRRHRHRPGRRALPGSLAGRDSQGPNRHAIHLAQPLQLPAPVGRLAVSTTPLEAAIPAPRGAAEPTRHQPEQPYAVRGQPGWLSMIEALDGFAGSLVARYEHQLTRANAVEVPRLRRQIEQARRLEATTAAAAAAARHIRHRVAPSPGR